MRKHIDTMSGGSVMEESVSSCLGSDEPSGAVDSYMNRSGGVGDSGERGGRLDRVSLPTAFVSRCQGDRVTTATPGHLRGSGRLHAGGDGERCSSRWLPRKLPQHQQCSEVCGFQAPRDERAALITSCRKRSEQGQGSGVKIPFQMEESKTHLCDHANGKPAVCSNN